MRQSHLSVGIILILILTLMMPLGLTLLAVPAAFAQPTWPSTWIAIDWDRNENGATDDWRDVEYAYYEYDESYLFLKLHCYGRPGLEWPAHEARYKWFIDVDGVMYYSGGNIFDAEYLLFVEDTNHDGTGEMYLLFDANDDNNFGEYEPWPPTNSLDYRITDPDIGGWQIVAPNQIEMYINWTHIGSPPSYGLFWSTDQQNPNLDQGPTTDRVDEEQAIIVHNVAAIGQTPIPTLVNQGEQVLVHVVVENKGTQTETFNVTSYFNCTGIGTELVDSLAAGHQVTLAFEWDTTGLPVGNYTIKAWADSSAAIVESNESDNWCNSAAVVTVLPALAHDVAAVSQVPDQTSVVQGTTVNVNVTVSNFGDFNETFNVTCFYDGIAIGCQTVTNLGSKTSANLVFAWNTTGVEPNTYYILAMADSSRVISEANENNNNCTSFEAVTVYSTGQMGQLYVDKVRTAVVQGEDPPVVGFATEYELTMIVTNIGGSEVSSITVNDTISGDATFVSVGTPSQGSILALPPPKIVWNVGTLTPGANATLTFRVSVAPTSLGLVYLNHKEDIVTSGIDTLSGTSVSATGRTDITVMPILRDVAATSQVPSSTVVSQGDTVAVHVTVTNLGNVTETFNITCYCGGDPIGVLRLYNIVAGGQEVISFPWDTTGQSPGTYSITAEADSSFEIAETDETNNICTSAATVQIVIHDISIISQEPSPTTVAQGEIVTVDVVVQNEGTESETFTVSCYVNETLLETQTVINMESNTTLTLTFIWNTTGATAGTYFINTVASTVSGEKDTDDNACRSATSVTVTVALHQITFRQTGVSTDYADTVLIVDGVNYQVTDLSVTFMWESGSPHSFSFQSPLVATANAKRYVWTSTTGLSTVQSGTFVVTSSGNITGNYGRQYYLTVSSPYGTPSGEGWYDYGTSAHASLTPALVDHGNSTRRVFTSWSGDASGINHAESNAILMDAPRTAMANWKTQYYLTVAIDPSGIAAIAGEGWYDQSTDVALVAPPVSGFTFLEWTVDSGSRGPGVKSISVGMSSPHTAVAHYRPVVVGGSAMGIGTPLLHHWIGIQTLLIVGLFAVASWKRRNQPAS